MFKKLIRIQDDIFYSPTHNTFFRVEPSEQVNFGDFLLEISGHEEKIFEFLISNYNNYVTKEALESEFPECSDPYDKTLDRLRRDKIEGKLKVYGLIKKAHGRVILYLSESPFRAEETIRSKDVSLLCRPDYYVDYDRIFADCARINAACREDAVPQSILRAWIDECAALTRYDERCLMLLERIGFLPAFGKKEDKKWFLAHAKELIYRFGEADVNAYGGTELLIFARSVLLAVIEYIEAQLRILLPEQDEKSLPRDFVHMLTHFRMIRMPEQTEINPLLLVAYYDYFGLTLYRNYLFRHDPAQLSEAADMTERSLEKARKVDMHLQIWAAFLTYNLARCASELGDHDKAVLNIQTAVILRQGLAECPFFSRDLQHDLYFEYLLARIVQTDIERKTELLSAEEAQAEYAEIRADMETGYGGSDSGDSQPYIRRLLSARMESN